MASVPNPLIKPTATPTGINAGSSLMTVAPLLYGFDPGNGGGIIDVTGNCTMQTENLPSNTTSFYGTSLNWQASAGDAGQGNHCAATTAINTATALKSLGVGAGWTMATTFYLTGAGYAPGGAIPFGRPSNAAENPPNSIWRLGMGGTATATQMFAAVDNNGAEAVLGNYDFGGYNVLGSAVIVAKNDSAGSATATYYINGASVGSMSGLALSVDGIETDIQFGTIYHVDTGHNFNTFTGQVFQGIFIPAAWTPTQIALFNTHPYDGLSF